MLLPWADIAPLSEHEGDFTFASAVDGLEGVSIFASGAQAALRAQVEVTVRGPHRQYRDVAALGGLPGQTHPRNDIRLVLNDEGIAVEAERGRLALLAWDTIAGVTVEGPTEARKRVTVTRIIALGVFALAVPKSESVSYLIVSLGHAREAAFEIRGVGPHQARADLLPFASKVRANQPGSAGVVPDLKARLRRLEELRDEELISDGEYQEQRARILAEL